MKYHAIIIIVDDNNNEITRFKSDEYEQINIPPYNMIVHKIFIGGLNIAESREMNQFIEDMRGNNNDR